MPDDPKLLKPDPTANIPDQDASDGAPLKTDAHPVFGSNVQPQEIYHEKAIGASAYDNLDQTDATDTADAHPVFGSSVQPQDVHDEKVIGASDTDDAVE